jgi:hypothetical protein
MVSPDQRASASSSPVVFDAMRGIVWTANGDVGTISLVDVDMGRVIQEIPVGTDIRSVGLSPDGAWVAAVDRAGASLTLIDARTRTVRRTIELGTHPRACVWDAANPRWLYVAIEDDGTVAIVDRTLGQVAATVDVGRLPSGLAVAGTQSELYVTHRIDADVTVVDLNQRTAIADIPLADEPFSDPSTPSGKPFGFESLAVTSGGQRAWIPHELLSSAHPLVFNQMLFPAISVVELLGRAEVQTDPNDVAGAIAGRKNLFDAIAAQGENGQPAVFSQICAVVMHPSGTVAWAIACGSEDLLTFSVPYGQLAATLRGIGGDQCDHPIGLTLDDTGQRLFVICDQSHTLLSFDTANGSPVGHLTMLGSPAPLIARDPVDPELRAGLTLFFRANSSKGTVATTANNWMSCGGCHLDGFTSSNLRLFESLTPHDPRYDAEIGHGFCARSAAGACIRLVDHFSTAPTPADPSFSPHDILVALLDQGGLTPNRLGDHPDPQIPMQPTPDQAEMARQLARVIARDLPRGPTWLASSGGAPNVDQDTAFCGKCHQAEYAAWTKSVHAHAAEDPMVLYGVGVEKGLAGTQFPRLCAGCHDPVSARAGDFSFGSKRGVTCLGCHEVGRPIRAGGNGDLAAATYDWTQDHKARAQSSLTRLRQPEFCGGCHQQFIPGTGLVAIGTLDEYHASQFVGQRACVDCHMSKDSKGVANHRAPGGNVFLGQMFGDDVLVQAQTANLTQAFLLRARRISGGVLVTVYNGGSGHGFPTGVTDIREPWVELQVKDASGNVLAHIGGPSTDKDLLPDGAARLGIDIAAVDGTVLLSHELTEATRVPFDVRVPAGQAQALYVPLPTAMPPGTASLDAVLYFRNVRTTYYRLATGDPGGAPPTIEIARTQVP